MACRKLVHLSSCTGGGGYTHTYTLYRNMQQSAYAASNQPGHIAHEVSVCIKLLSVALSAAGFVL